MWDDKDFKDCRVRNLGCFAVRCWGAFWDCQVLFSLVSLSLWLTCHHYGTRSDTKHLFFVCLHSRAKDLISSSGNGCSGFYVRVCYFCMFTYLGQSFSARLMVISAFNLTEVFIHRNYMYSWGKVCLVNKWSDIWNTLCALCSFKGFTNFFS